MSVSKAVMYQDGKPEKPSIFLLVATGVVVIRIDGTTIHESMPEVNCIRTKLYQTETFQNILVEFKIIIINKM